MSHEVLGTGAVPVLFAVRSEDDIAGMEFDHLLSPGLDQATPLRYVKGLSAVVGAPGGACAGSEAHGGQIEPRRRQTAGAGIDPHLAGERLGWPPGGMPPGRDPAPTVP